MLDNYQDLIDELLGTPDVVRGAAGLGERAMVQIAAMVARDRLVLERVQRIKNQTDPYLKPLPSPEELRLSVDPGEIEDAEALVDSFETARGDLVSLLMNLTLRDWERTATTDDEGIITLADEVERHVEFDEEVRAALSQLAG